MPKYTSFLELTLPELREFVNSWHLPVNQNMEDLDDFCEDLFKSLMTTGGSSTWAALRGTTASLATRLDVSINADGSLNVTGSPAILGMGISAVGGQYVSPAARLDDADFLRYAARQPFVGGRYVPVPTAGPAASFPPEELDSGIAFRTADFGAKTGTPISAPGRPWAPGLVAGGANPLISGLGVGQVRFTADAPAAVFNIDGYLFRIREIIDLDWNLLAPANGTYLWFFVDRNEGTYNSANFRYTAPGGGAVAAKDLRKLQTGVGNGTTSSSTFTSAGGQFSTKAFGKVKKGDVLVITTTAAAGSYVIDALDGVTPDTKLTIKGKFLADIAGANWHILDSAHPNIGVVATDLTPTTLPAFVAGRVYIGRAIHNAGGAPTSIVTFLAGGVYDSGWIDVDAAVDFPLTLTHNLGAYPSDVQVWCRTNATAQDQYQPMVRRSIVTDAAGPTSANLLLPSLQVRSSAVATVLRLLNASTTPLKPNALFTDSTDTDQTVCQIRVIARK